MNFVHSLVKRLLFSSKQLFGGKKKSQLHDSCTNITNSSYSITTEGNLARMSLWWLPRKLLLNPILFFLKMRQELIKRNLWSIQEFFDNTDHQLLMDLFCQYRPLEMDYFKKGTPVILAHQDIIHLLVSFQSKHYE